MLRSPPRHPSYNSVLLCSSHFTRKVVNACQGIMFKHSDSLHIFAAQAQIFHQGLTFGPRHEHTNTQTHTSSLILVLYLMLAFDFKMTDCTTTLCFYTEYLMNTQKTRTLLNKFETTQNRFEKSSLMCKTQIQMFAGTGEFTS